MSHAEVVDPPISGKIPPRIRSIPILGNSLQLAGNPDAFFVEKERYFSRDILTGVGITSVPHREDDHGS